MRSNDAQTITGPDCSFCLFSIVLECVPSILAKKITETVKIPTIGIGAGKYTDGQILVSDDIFGLNSVIKPKFVKKYADVNTIIKNALSEYKQEVFTENFPNENFSY